MTVIPLGRLQAGARGQVCGFAIENALTHRLMTLGVIEGTDIEFLRCAPTGDPIEVNVLGYALSLRRSEADLILVACDTP